jgi:hypothetical protein
MQGKKPGYSICCLVLLVVITFSSCKYSKEYKLAKGGDKFTLMVPSWAKEDEKLKPGAEFQYANRFRNFYAIGETENKDSTKNLSSLMASNLTVLSKAMTKPVISDSIGVTIGGLNGSRVEIFGNMSNEAIYFSEVVLEGKSRFYHFSVWTRTADRKLKFKNDIDSILNSFKEQ